MSQTPQIPNLKAIQAQLATIQTLRGIPSVVPTNYQTNLEDLAQNLVGTMMSRLHLTRTDTSLLPRDNGNDLASTIIKSPEALEVLNQTQAIYQSLETDHNIRRMTNAGRNFMVLHSGVQKLQVSKGGPPTGPVRCLSSSVTRPYSLLSSAPHSFPRTRFHWRSRDRIGPRRYSLSRLR